jgi:hypothetical protein
MACADHSKHAVRARRQFPSSRTKTMQEFKSGIKSSKVKLNVQEISNGLPFVIDDQEISFADRNLDVKNIFTDAKEVVDGVRRLLSLNTTEEI